MKHLFNLQAARRVAGIGTAASMLASVAALIMVSLAAEQDLPDFRAPAEQLTENEARYVQTFFGNIDTAPVRKHQEDDTWVTFFQGLLGLAYGNDMGFYGASIHADDYALAATLPKAVFMHEATHIWQHQDRSLPPDVRLEKRMFCALMEDPEQSEYEYDPARYSRFDSYCPEQQAAMVEDYTTIYLTGGRDIHIIYLFERSLPQGYDRILMTRLVEAKFPGAAQMRARYAAGLNPAP